MTAASVGEWTAEMAVTEEVEDMCIKMKSDIEKKAGVQFDVFIPKTYRSEPQCGGHYLVKVKVGDDKHVHVKVCGNVRDGKVTEDTCLTVKEVQYKSKSHPLEPFGKTTCGK